MNKDTLQGNFKKFTGQIKKQWGKLTDDDLSAAEGNIDSLIGKIQERYGIAKDEATKQMDKWAEKIKEGSNA